MDKVKLTASEISQIQTHMKSALTMSANDRDSFIARTIGEVYDVEFPIPAVIDAISRIERADLGEHVYYLTPSDVAKELYTLTTDCNVTQVKVTPNTRTELDFNALISPEYYVCIHDWLRGDHEVLSFYADAILEAMNRQEAYAVLQLVDAGAVAETNTFVLDSGNDKFDFPKLVQMARSVAKYGQKLVLVTGANVTTDIVLMDYDSNKQREHGIGSIVDQHIPIEECTVVIDGITKTVIDVDDAYLIAVSDSKANKPVVFARRKLDPIADAADTRLVAKERAVIDTGNMINVGANRKFSRGKAGFEDYGAVLVNSKVIAKFTRTN